MWSSDYGLNTRGSHILYIYILWTYSYLTSITNLSFWPLLASCKSWGKVFILDHHEYWSDPPTNSGIMDFNCNFPAKIAQQPRDQNHKQFERPNLLNPNFSDVEPKYEITLGAAYLEPGQIYSVGACRKKNWIQSLLGKGKGSSAGMSLLRDTFFSDKFC